MDNFDRAFALCYRTNIEDAGFRVNDFLVVTKRGDVDDFQAIKTIISILLLIGGTYIQAESKNKNLCDFIYGTEFVLAALIIIATL